MCLSLWNVIHHFCLSVFNYICLFVGWACVCHSLGVEVHGQFVESLLPKNQTAGKMP